WTALIHGYIENVQYNEALSMFSLMLSESVEPLNFTIASVFKALAREKKVKDGAGVYGVVFKLGFGFDLIVQNAVIDFFMRCGEVGFARRVFDEMHEKDIVSWNSVISGYGFCKAGDIEAAKEHFDKMPDRDVISWTMMIDGYVKAGDVDSARCLFDQMPEKNLITWSTMIGGYAKNGQPRNALDLYKNFKGQGIKPDKTFILAIISACSQLGILNAAESIIHDFVGPSLFSSLKLVTSLIDMYAKCGSIERAMQVFKMAHSKDLLCYNTMITAFANHGLGQSAISLFCEMQMANIKPDGVAFLGVLSACNHGGLVDEGKRYFKQMMEEYEIQPSEKHYACIIDLLGRAGCLEEAHYLISNMPIAPTAVVWGALLAACRVHCNLQLAEVAAAELFKIEPDNSGSYILLSSTYAAARRWDCVDKLRVMLRKNKVRKNRGSSWIELGCVVHEFVMGDASHFDTESIYFILHVISEDMK
ncbi:PPR domain-containing protein/PPR_2 domain-containing protein, partial [Cephalotus follicularis]